MHPVSAAHHLTVASLLAPAVWPPHTAILETDVIVDGSSLAEAARAGTPAVRIREAEPHAFGTDPRRQRFVSLVLTRVTAIGLDDHGRRAVSLDADLARADPCLDAVRVIGRHTTRRLRRVRLGSAHGLAGSSVRLPRDLSDGDVLVIPCDGTLALADLVRRPGEPDSSIGDFPTACR